MIVTSINFLEVQQKVNDGIEKNKIKEKLHIDWQNKFNTIYRKDIRIVL